MSVKYSSWEKKRKKFNHIQYPYICGLMIISMNEIVKPIGGLYSQLSVSQFIQHEVTTVLLVDFI